MRTGKVGLIIVIALGVLLALLPVVINIVDETLYKQTHARTTTTTVGSSAKVKILVPEVESHVGADKLVVIPGKAIVDPNSTVDVIIYVYFKHSQPCAHPNWHIDYKVRGGLEIVGDDGGKLIDPKTYKRVLKVRVLSSGNITVTYYYGSGCPEGTIEQVKVELLTSTKNISGTSTITNATSTTSKEVGGYIRISGIVKQKDALHRALYISNKIIYIRGRWLLQGTGEILDSSEVLERIPVGAHIIVICKLSKTGRLQATKIIINNKTIYTRS